MSRKHVFLVFISCLLIVASVYRIVSSDSLVNSQCSFPSSGTVHNLDTGLNYTTTQEATDVNMTLNGHTIDHASSLAGQTWIVNSPMDSGWGTLRWCLMNATNGDTITFDASVFPPTSPVSIVLTSALPPIIQGNLTIVASGTYPGVILNGSQTPADTAGLLVDSANNTIKGLQILHFPGGGIKLTANARGCSIFGNNVTANNATGIFFYGSSNNNISDNIISNSFSGISVSLSSGNTISDNTVTHNENGVSLQSSSGNTISDNIITHNNHGVSFTVSYNNVVSSNTFSSNRFEGMFFSLSYNNVVSGNIMTNNSWGIFLFASGNNTIYHNNFNNTNQVESDEKNLWDNGVEGNYWANYIGVDNDHDGIGDSWYEIAENNTDHYPLMGMFSDFNVTSEHNVQTVCNSSISDFSFNGTAIRFNVTGVGGSDGFCRICIPKALMNDTFGVFVNGTEILPAPEPLSCSNTTHTYLYFSYTHSTQEVVVIPQFPSLMILLLYMTATLLAVILHRRRHTL